MSNAPEERLVLLAEGYSGDPHYGKTARGVLAYGERPVVALLDSTRAGETQAGVPIVATVDDALGMAPTTAVVGVATQGGRFPPAWRELLKSCIASGLHLENGLHQFLADDPELVALAERHGIPCVNHTYGYALNAAASLHFVAAIHHTDLFECQATPNEIRDALDSAPLRPKDGWVSVPSGPGLGISIDEAALARFSRPARG